MSLARFIIKPLQPKLSSPRPRVAIAMLPDAAALSYWPPDLALRTVEAMHTTADLPWWGAVVASSSLRSRSHWASGMSTEPITASSA